MRTSSSKPSKAKGANPPRSTDDDALIVFVHPPNTQSEVTSWPLMKSSLLEIGPFANMPTTWNQAPSNGPPPKPQQSLAFVSKQRLTADGPFPLSHRLSSPGGRKLSTLLTEASKASAS